MKRRTFVTNVAAAALAPLVRVAPVSSPLRADGERVNAWLARFDVVGRTAGGINLRDRDTATLDRVEGRVPAHRA